MASNESQPPDTTENSSVSSTPQAPGENKSIVTPDTGQMETGELEPPVVAKQPVNGMPTLKDPQQQGGSETHNSLSVSDTTEVQTPQTPEKECSPARVTSEVPVSTSEGQQLKETEKPEPTPILVPVPLKSDFIKSQESDTTQAIVETKPELDIPVQKEIIAESQDVVSLPAPVESTEPVPVQSNSGDLSQITNTAEVKSEILVPIPILIQDSSLQPADKALTADINIPPMPELVPSTEHTPVYPIANHPTSDPTGMDITSENMTSHEIPSEGAMSEVVTQAMEIQDMTSCSSESVSRADCSTQSSELINTEGEEGDYMRTNVSPDKNETGQQQEAESVVMDTTTELPQESTAQILTPAIIDTNQSLNIPAIDSPTVETVEVPMSPVCVSEAVLIDPALVPLPPDLDSIESPGVPNQIQSVAIDTIVIADSPAPSSHEDHMEVIDLTSDCSPEPHTPSNAQCATTPPSKRSKVSLSSYGDTEDSKPTSSSLLSRDLELLELLINSCDMLGGLSVEDQKISFSFLHKGVRITSTLICIEEDYPQITLTVSSEQREKSDILSKRLPYVAWDVLKECCGKQAVSPPPVDSLPPQLIELLQTAAPFHTQISTQSTASQTSNCTDGEYDEIEPSDDEYNEFDEVDEEVGMHALLERDIERVKQKHGQYALETRNYGSIGDIDIDLVIDMNFLEPEIARAWGVKHTVPLVVRLSLNSEHYLDGADIKVEVFQEDRGNAKGICKQVEKIISQFISISMKATKNPLCNTKVEESVEAYNNLEQKLAEKRRVIHKSGGPSSEKKGMLAQLMGKFSRDKQIDCDMLVAQLVEMGWETELAVHALQECNMDMEKALDYLSEERVDAPSESDEENPKSFEKQKSRGAEVSGLDWMSDIQDTNEAALKSKTCPPLSHGFLCQVIQYLLNRIPTLNDFCVICDETHLFCNGAMLKPTVCARELCSFAFQTLGVMADVADSIATGPEVVELLVAMCNAACLSGRRNDILDPYPTVVDTNNPKQFALHPKDKDFKKVEKAMGFVVQELKALPAVLKERLDSLDTTSFPLLQWVLASNRCHIVKLTPDRQIKSMGTTHQFLLLSAPPAKEAAFRKLKQKNKSIYAFHGSNLENWHSIMRNGLMNASGTKFQLHGAAYGAGIYLSPHASVSFGYSGIHGGHPSQTDKKKGRPTMLSSQNLNCIALCEVIDIKIKKSGNIWVVPESDHVVTRFFFVYEDNTTGDTNFDTREDKYIKEIEHAVKSLIQS